jgi:hypothetical protein
MRHVSHHQSATTRQSVEAGELRSFGTVRKNGSIIPPGSRVEVLERPHDYARISWRGLHAWVPAIDLDPIPERTWS